MSNKLIKLLSVATVAALFVTTYSCKKTIDRTDDNNPPPTKLDTANSTVLDRLYDTMYLYALQTYYWNDQLPEYAGFLPRQYKTSDTLNGLEQELFQITRIPKDASGYLYEQRIDYDKFGDPQPDNSEPKYSYILPTKATVNGGAGAFVRNNNFTKNLKMTLDGKDSGMGVIVGLMPVKYFDDSTEIVNSGIVPDKNTTVAAIRFVIKGSPADSMGLKRGDIIFKANNDSLNFDTKYDASVAALNMAIFDGKSSNIGVYFTKNDSIATVHLTQKLYTFNPIFKSVTLDYGGKKIGYIAFYTFSDLDNAKHALDTAFQSFAAKGVTDLAVDLRYNGGGFVSTSEHFANLIVPSTANNKTMYTSYYNSMMVNKKATILKQLAILDGSGNPTGHTYFDIDYSPAAQKVNFDKAGSLGSLNSVYFIVSSGTASASELLINNLKPYMPVTLIGAAFSDNAKYTYGKPVGFFEEKFGSYSMWIPNFETKNANDEGGYYKGMLTNHQSFDDISRAFGDPKEDCLAEAIYLISGVDPEAQSFSGFRKALQIHKSIKDVKAIGNVNKITDMVIQPKRVFKK